ncbi:MAG: helix-turn-helix domain-containing protein [Roseburia inulinivorans]
MTGACRTISYNRKKKVNYTQEKISEGICSVESYSRIENGRKPTLE